MKISCVIPAFNEEKTIANVIANVKKVRTIDEIIVVDDGSTDKTYKVACEQEVKVLKHPVNKGKGAAIKTGILAAQGEAILFLDADLYSISPRKIAAMLQPIENDEADFVKAAFNRARGRVTELVVKPLLNVILPFIKFNQPLSGQFVIRKELAGELNINDHWGVDMQILLQLVKKGVRIVEVDIGRLAHKKQPIENLAIMSEQVIQTVLAELGLIANKHKLVVFDFDKTLIEESSIEVISRSWGFETELLSLRKENEAGRLKGYELTLALARFFKGKAEQELRQILDSINPKSAAIGTINRLKKRKYEVGIISEAFSAVLSYFAEIYGIVLENIISPVLVKDKREIFTGEVIARTRYNSKCCDRIICKADALMELMKRLGVRPEECIAVGDGKSDDCLFRMSGLALALEPLQPIGDIKISNLAEVLIYAD